MFKHKNTEVAHYPANSKKQKDRTVINTLENWRRKWQYMQKQIKSIWVYPEKLQKIGRSFTYPRQKSWKPTIFKTFLKLTNLSKNPIKSLEMFIHPSRISLKYS